MSNQSASGDGPALGQGQLRGVGYALQESSILQGEISSDMVSSLESILTHLRRSVYVNSRC